MHALFVCTLRCAAAMPLRACKSQGARSHSLTFEQQHRRCYGADSSANARASALIELMFAIVFVFCFRTSIFGTGENLCTGLLLELRASLAAMAAGPNRTESNRCNCAGRHAYMQCTCSSSRLNHPPPPSPVLLVSNRISSEWWLWRLLFVCRCLCELCKTGAFSDTTGGLDVVDILAAVTERGRESESVR